ncbi:hypothetical protein K440DRAFT_637454 [Wilcoxina mikolae CBS 423.85]|nr:hypothetical protein K440DRAFT_637454 [Wilcoxina mikolae CBS 423.85]
MHSNLEILKGVNSRPTLRAIDRISESAILKVEISNRCLTIYPGPAEGLAVGGCVGRHGLRAFYHLSFIPIEKVLQWASEEFCEEFYVPSLDELDQAMNSEDLKEPDEQDEQEGREELDQAAKGDDPKESGEQEDGNIAVRPNVRRHRYRHW